MTSVSGDADLIVIARAVRPRGLKGELVAEVLTDFPNRFEEVTSVVGVGPQEEKVLVLEEFWFQNDRVILKFAGYDDVEAAQTLVGFQFALPATERVQLSEGEYYDWELEGCAVVVENGPGLGAVREVLRTGGVALLVVADDNDKEQFIPLAQSIVTRIDVVKKEILIDPPEGLLDL